MALCTDLDNKKHLSGGYSRMCLIGRTIFNNVMFSTLVHVSFFSGDDRAPYLRRNQVFWRFDSPCWMMARRTYLTSGLD